MKKTVTVSLDVEVWRKAKERLENVSKEVNEFLKHRVSFKNPEKLNEVKETLEDLEKEINELEEKKKERKENVELIKEKIENKKISKKNLEKKLEKIDKEIGDNVLKNGDKFTSNFINDDVTGEGGKIKAFNVANEQECEECGKELDHNSLVRLYEIDKYFICESCFSNKPQKYEGSNSKKKRTNYSPKGVLRVDL